MADNLFSYQDDPDCQKATKAVQKATQKFVQELNTISSRYPGVGMTDTHSRERLVDYIVEQVASKL